MPRTWLTPARHTQKRPLPLGFPVRWQPPPDLGTLSERTMPIQRRPRRPRPTDPGAPRRRERGRQRSRQNDQDPRGIGGALWPAPARSAGRLVPRALVTLVVALALAAMVAALVLLATDCASGSDGAEAASAHSLSHPSTHARSTS